MVAYPGLGGEHRAVETGGVRHCRLGLDSQSVVWYITDMTSGRRPGGETKTPEGGTHDDRRRVLGERPKGLRQANRTVGDQRSEGLHGSPEHDSWALRGLSLGVP